MRSASFWLAVWLTGFVSAFPIPAQEATSRAQEHTLATLPKSRFFVVPPREAGPAGAALRLLVVLPGGAGTSDFLPFVENGILAQAPPGTVGVLVAAVKWRDDQRIVWPTAKNKVPGMAYTTEEYVRAVVAAVEQDHRIDPAGRAVLGWSSSGPAVFPLLAAADGPFARGYVAMSVWPGKALGDLAGAAGRRIVLDQSPDDQVTKFAHVRDAFAALDAAGAVVRLSTYAGGHGWNDAPLGRLRDGLGWLFGDEPAPAPQWPGTAAKAAPRGKAAPARDNLLENGGFEDGLQGWQRVDNSQRTKVAAVETGAKSGKRALHVAKSGGPPLDLVVQEVALQDCKKVTVSLQLRSKGCKNAWVKVWLYGDGEKPLHEDVDLVRVPADSDWQAYEKSWDGKGATRAVVQIVAAMGGELWVDDVVLRAAK